MRRQIRECPPYLNDSYWLLWRALSRLPFWKKRCGSSQLKALSVRTLYNSPQFQQSLQNQQRWHVVKGSLMALGSLLCILLTGGQRPTAARTSSSTTILPSAAPLRSYWHDTKTNMYLILRSALMNPSWFLLHQRELGTLHNDYISSAREFLANNRWEPHMSQSPVRG